MGQSTAGLPKEKGQVPHVIHEGHDPMAGFIEKGVLHASYPIGRKIKNIE
jgi:hypothetical protein